MDQETYEHHKQQIAAGQIARVGGRTAATVTELDALRRIDGQTVFGSQPPAKPGEVMAIDSGRLTPADIEAMGPEHPLIVAAQRLTLSQLDALVDHVTQPLLDELQSKDDALKAKDDAPKPETEQDMTLSDDPRKQAVQARMATGAADNITPKTVIDNKTNSTTPAGKNASKPAADDVQDQEKAAAENGG